jgi:glycosyltransferase involved in cell wall biosynthesis
VVHLAGGLAEEAMPALMRACDCLVHPYRAEGFGLPVLEAMACGLPAIIPDGGAARDYAGSGTALTVASAPLVASPEAEGMRLVGTPSLVEVQVDELAATLRGAAEDPAAGRELGARATVAARGRHTWGHTAAALLERARALTGACAAVGQDNLKDPGPLPIVGAPGRR